MPRLAASVTMMFNEWPLLDRFEQAVGDHEKVSVSDSWSSGVILGLLTAGCRVNGYGTCVGGCAAAG